MYNSILFHEATRSFRRSRGKHGLFIQHIRIVLPSIRVPVTAVPVALKLRARLFVFGPTCIAFRSPLPRSFRAAAQTLRACVTRTTNITHYRIQRVSLCMVHNEVRCRSCVLFFATAGEKLVFSSFVPVYGHSLKVYVRQKANGVRQSASTRRTRGPTRCTRNVTSAASAFKSRGFRLFERKLLESFATVKWCMCGYAKPNFTS